jgi:hypothetical protein
MSDYAGWLDQFTAGDLSPMGQALLQQQMTDAKAEADEERAEAEREAARQERRDNTLLADRQAGGAMAEISRQRALAGEADDRCRDLEAQLAKWQGKRDRALSNVEFWAQRMQLASDQVQRSVSGADLGPLQQASRRAHREFLEATRARRAGAGTAVRSSRPFGDGYAARNEPVTCPHCLALPGVTPEELAAVSFAIHHSDADGNPLAAPADRPVPVTVTDDAERAREVDRLVGAGFSRDTAEWATPGMITR